MNYLAEFKFKKVAINEIKLYSLNDSQIDFWNVGLPVVDVKDGKTGVIALFGIPRTYPRLSMIRKGWKVNREEFFKLFPFTKFYFNKRKI